MGGLLQRRLAGGGGGVCRGHLHACLFLPSFRLLALPALTWRHLRAVPLQVDSSRVFFKALAPEGGASGKLLPLGAAAGGGAWRRVLARCRQRAVRRQPAELRAPPASRLQTWGSLSSTTHGRTGWTWWWWARAAWAAGSGEHNQPRGGGGQGAPGTRSRVGLLLRVFFTLLACPAPPLPPAGPSCRLWAWAA